MIDKTLGKKRFDMKKFERPEIEVELFNVVDVIATSTETETEKPTRVENYTDWG